ncbi:hypothetical protein [Leptolyngbya sp. FACHB-261]|uniref:hypothetical protein n=1 Tax=Leptolyngbya sp. FACHB-261 TaxID=2692806 RepID=UPI001687C8F3|nr:hypothetical protein [Leptolyngbya sp. FACHB-261]MBD2100080.1 hypothetical protein [Leptolyngbya sp. FACHB-261]
MTYRKRRSTTLEKAQARLSGLQSIRLDLNLGNGLTLQNYIALIATAGDRLQAHNLALSEVDRTRIELAESEAAVSNLSSRVLSAVVAMYGKDSKEYELAGGKPPSGYKRAKQQAPAVNLNQLEDGNKPSANGAATNGTGAVSLSH